MSFQEKLELLLQSTVQEKDEEIKILKEQNERLREENERLKQIKADPQLVSNRYGDIKSKAVDLKKALDEFLEIPNRSMHPQRLHPATFSPISIPNSNVDVSKPSASTNENTKFRPGPADDLSVNGTNHHVNRTNYNSQEDFGTRQEFRPETDTDIINQATQEEMSRQQQHHFHNPTHNLHNGHAHSNLPTTLNLNSLNNGGINTINPQRRFGGGGYNALSGTNNNNNNNRVRNNHNNNNSKYTIFISWPGSMTTEQLRELFESASIDFADIRYTSPKQFAHVDLKSEVALNKAMALNGEVKNKEQGALRVEHGKPRSSNNNNPTENGQRPQNQNKNFSRPNNKNPNGYNTNLPQKQPNKYPNYNNHNNQHNHNHNNHSGQYQASFAPSDDKENGISGWNSFSQQETKQSGEN